MTSPSLPENGRVEEEQEIERILDTQETRPKRARPTPRNSKPVPKPKSDMFVKHFTLIKIKQDLKAKCNYCKPPNETLYAWTKGNGHGTLIGHMTNVHPTEFGITTTQSQLQVASSAMGGGTMSLFKYNDPTWRNEMTKYIAMHHLPFNHCDSVIFTSPFQKGANPAIKRIPKTSLTRNLLKMVTEKKVELVKKFDSMTCNVALCSDIWSDHWNEHSYMGVTCHWIDESWKLNKLLLAYRMFDDTHTADNITNLMHIMLQEYSLTGKVFSIGFDNASANTASIDELSKLCQPCVGGKYFHIRCVCHILNLCVQDGLRTLKDHVAPIKKATTYLWAHSNAARAFAKLCQQNGKKPKKWNRDVPTRWNSTYNLLKASFEYKDELCAFFQQHDFGIRIYPSHWSKCTRLCEMLKIFQEATNVLSGVYYPTSHLVLDHCLNIAAAFSECIVEPTLHDTIIVMRKKWMKYFNNIPELFLIAFVLDPTRKLEDLETWLTAYYDALYVEDSSDFERPDVSFIIHNVRAGLEKVYREYALKIGEIDTPPQQMELDETIVGVKLSAAERLKMQKKGKQQRGSSGRGSTVELENYYNTYVDPRWIENGTFDILEWWKQASHFPVLSNIAREVLACPVSTVAVEQSFSQGGHILDERRSKINPETLEAQCLLDDWSKAELRSQEEHSDDEDEAYPLTDRDES